MLIKACFQAWHAIIATMNRTDQTELQHNLIGILHSLEKAVHMIISKNVKKCCCQ